jgi:ornithine cyclodeaminase/alanine dehydrogenase-like protein (mu-crystallin family)
VLTDRAPGRQSDDDITVFKNNAGQGIADVAVGMLVLERAASLGRGRSLG